MDTILVVGIDTVLGANLAATFADRYRVVGLSTSSPISIAGCQSALCRSQNRQAVREWIMSVRPDWVVHCGPASISTWDRPNPILSANQVIDAARHWASSAAEIDCHLTLVSSDAVFTGPWMFHGEECPCVCPSRQAQTIRDMECQAAALCSKTLIVRTNAFGWSPDPTGRGWIERTLARLESRSAGPFDHVRHATPILATDLADILESACQHALHGIYHIAGAERVSPAGFVQNLAEQFDLPAPQPETMHTLSQRPTGFGLGETSLQTKKIRNALNIRMPMLDDGLERLYEQQQNGYSERFNSATATLHEKVA